MNSITLLDGATGTRLWALAQERGIEKASTWLYNITHPELVTQAEGEYVEAGSQIILTNTFNANAPEIEPSSTHTVTEVISAAVKAAKQATKGTKVKTALDIGPLTELLEPYGDLEAETASAIFAQQMAAGADAGAELIFLETFMDLEMIKLAAVEALKTGLPVFCSMTFAKGGRTMFGNRVEDVVKTLEPMGVAALGINCSLGPDLALPIVREFSEKTGLPLIFKPNAGMPVICDDGSIRYDLSAQGFAFQSKQSFPYASYIGGCCGTDASYIRELQRALNPL